MSDINGMRLYEYLKLTRNNCNKLFKDKGNISNIWPVSVFNILSLNSEENDVTEHDYT